MKKSEKVKGFILYRIFYGDTLVYVGRTKQLLQDRIRGHLFRKPMHRTISIEQVTKIEYAELQTEADMNLYEIYCIVKWHPPLNVDDKARDYPTVELPDIEWKEFTTHLWEKWKKELAEIDEKYEAVLERYRAIPKEIKKLRIARSSGEILSGDYLLKRAELDREFKEVSIKMHSPNWY